MTTRLIDWLQPNTDGIAECSHRHWLLRPDRPCERCERARIDDALNGFSRIVTASWVEALLRLWLDAGVPEQRVHALADAWRPMGMR